MAKKTFVVWYDVVETWKVYFEAESLEEAQAIVQKVDVGDKDFEWLHEAHNGFEKNKGIDTHIDFQSIEEVKR